MKRRFTRDQKMIVVQGILGIVLSIDVLQLWLLVATMNSFLGGDGGVPIPAAIFSAICLLLNLGLLRFLYRLDHKAPPVEGSRHEPKA